MSQVILSVVVPLYNEQEVLSETYRRLKTVMDSIGEPYEVVMVNDGSHDRTAAMAKAICSEDPGFKLINFPAISDIRRQSPQEWIIHPARRLL